MFAGIRGSEHSFETTQALMGSLAWRAASSFGEAPACCEPLLLHLHSSMHMLLFSMYWKVSVPTTCRPVQVSSDSFPVWAQAGADGCAHSPALPRFQTLQHLSEVTLRRESVPLAAGSPDSHAANEQDGEGYPEIPKHANLFPLSAADVLGWIIACITIFIAAGVLPRRVSQPISVDARTQ